MAMKVVYATVNGRVLSQTRSGVRSFYSLDPLGNTRALYDNTQTKTDTFTYTPFGTVTRPTGTTPTPFQWNGGSGYYQNSATRVYVRARNYYANLGKWSTQDPIGFDGGDFNLYRYVHNRVVIATDPSGLLTDQCKSTPVRDQINCWDKFCAKVEGSDSRHCNGDEWNSCVQWCRGQNNVKYCCQTKHILNQCQCVHDPFDHNPCHPPHDPCAEANDHQHSGASVCCNGKMIICDWTGSVYPFKSCIRQHEKCHLPHSACQGDGDLTKFLPGMQAQGECVCYYAEIQCLRRTGPGICRSHPNPKLCQDILKKRINQLCCGMDWYCGQAGSPGCKAILGLNCNPNMPLPIVFD